MALTKIVTPELFDFSSLNTALQLPTGDTASRPSSPSTGEWRYNTTLKYVEYYDGADWFQIDTEAIANPDEFPSENFNVNTYWGTGAGQTINAKFNEAANFNGSSSGIELPSILPANSTASSSATLWFKTDDTSGSQQTLIEAWDGSTGNDGAWAVWKDVGNVLRLGSYYLNGSALGTDGTTNVADGNWHFIAVVFDYSGATLSLYLDGNSTPEVQFTGLTPGTVNIFSGSSALGYQIQGGPFRYFPGSMDQFRIYSDALTTSEISYIYTNETTTTAAELNPSGFPTNCVAAYQLDGDASDLSGTYGGATTDIGYTGLKFAPDFVWVKNRTDSSTQNLLTDTVRGIGSSGGANILYSDSNEAESTNADTGFLSSFDSNGFTVGNNSIYNNSGKIFVAWCWKAPDAFSHSASGSQLASTGKSNQAAGFSIVSYTGNNSSGATVKHNLGATPELMIVKRRDAISDWNVYSATTGETKYLILDTNQSVLTASNIWNNTAPDDSVFTIGNHSSVNANSGTYIAYCFRSVDGYSRTSKYDGDGANPGPIIYTTNDGTATGTDGFEPSFLLVKRTDSAANWRIVDNKRNPANPRNSVLYPSLTNAEYTNAVENVNFFTNGFQIATTDTNWNASGGTYLFLAIGANKDTSVPTVTNSFSPTLYTGTDAAQSIFTATQFGEMNWFKNTGAISHAIVDIVRSRAEYIFPDDNVVQASSASDKDLVSFDPNGFTLGPVSAAGSTNASSGSTIAWSWKAGGLPTIQNGGTITSIVSSNQAAGFSIVTYEGNGLSGATIPHNLGGTPELVLNKCVSDPKDWNVFNSSLTTNYMMKLNTSGAQFDGAAGTNGGAFTVDSTLLTVVGGLATQNNNNASGESFIAYCFRSITGYVDVGSYAGVSTGTRTHVTGFEPSFVMIKGTNFSDSWYMYDNKRRTPPSSILFADLSDAEYTIDNSALYVTFVSGGAGVGGFTTSGALSGIDGATRNFMYIAIK